LLHSRFYSAYTGEVRVTSLSEGEPQSIKAHRVVGEGRRHDAIEDSEVDSTAEGTLDWRGFTMFAAIVTLIGWVSGVMLAAGARCVHSGGEELCGVGGYSGGVAMLVFGGLGPFALAAAWVSSILGMERGIEWMGSRIIGMSIALPLIVMAGAGSACVHSHGEIELCGPGGEGGGIAMVVLGSVMLMIPCGFWVLYLCFPT
jgi:hypothetical protein